MPVVYRFKLIPNLSQLPVMQSWLGMLCGLVNYNLADRIDSYNQGFIQGNYCNLKTQAEACPLTCSVVRSASNGEPWKSDKASLRRGSKPFNPKRSAYEMQSSALKTLKLARSWYKCLNTDVMQQALRHLDTAFNNFFTGRAKFPRFKSRYAFNSFEFKPGTVTIKGNRIRLPTLGWMRFFKSRDLPSGCSIRTVTVRKLVDGWYASVLLTDETIPDVLVKKVSELKTVNAVDRGIAKIVACADGTVVANPLIGQRFERRLTIRQKALSRKKKGSKNRVKVRIKVALVHQKIKNVRDDYQWKLAGIIARSADVIGLEDLNVKGMMARCKPKVDPETGKYLKNGARAKSGLSKAIADAAWHGLYLKIKSQAEKLGNWVELVDPRYSSQQCSVCGFTSPTNRAKEKFICESCNYYDDADCNAAKTLATRVIKKLGIASLLVVNQKVTPVLELTRNLTKKEISSALADEPGNLTKKGEQSVVNIQLNLFDYDLFGESTSIPSSG